MRDFTKYKQDRIMQFLENKSISNFIKDNKLDNSFIYENFNVFNECLKSIELCKYCSGLENCKQKMKGEIVGLSYDGIVSNNVVRCEYLLSKMKYDNQFKSFAYTDIPSNLSDLTLDNIEIGESTLSQLFVMVNNIYEGKSYKGLYIYGDLGVGKTYLCIALANSLVKANKTVGFVKVNNFATEMARLIRDDAFAYEKTVNKLRKAEYLILDDIGSEIVTEFVRDRLLFNIIDYRMENKLCTIFTSNLDKDTLMKHFNFDQNSVNTRRLVERIDIITDDYCLKGINKRRLA